MLEVEIVTDADLDKAYGQANFAGMSKRDVIRQGVLKCASGFYQGQTSKTICQDLGLIDQEYRVTPKGREYLWAAFSLPNSV